MTPTRKVFPVGLLLEGRQCLVLGGGKIAARKTRLLLDGGARVTVTAPEAAPEIAALALQGAVQWQPRVFTPDDLAGADLVYAATNDPDVNREIIRLCRARRILCCAVDAAWPGGDFVTPAVLRTDGLTVAVNTAGRACRRSRLVKESLARHVASVSGARPFVLGASHAELDVGARGQLHLTGDRRARAGRMLRNLLGLHEFLILSTCNRIELHAVGALDDAGMDLIKQILGFARLAPDQFYLRHDLAAFEHTGALCAGLLSQLPGENHIVAQMKDALGLAVDAGWAGGLMQEWMSATLHVSKDVRQATAPHLHGREIEDLAADYLGAEGAGAGRLLVLGTGKIGAGFLQKALAGRPDLRADWCYHRHRPTPPPDLASRIDLHDLRELPALLPRADIIVTALSADNYILTAAHAAAFQTGRTVPVLDLAMPRNTDPALAAAAASLQVVDLDGLKCWHRREQADLAHLQELSRQIVRAHRDYYDKFTASFQSGHAQQ